MCTIYTFFSTNIIRVIFSSFSVLKRGEDWLERHLWSTYRSWDRVHFLPSAKNSLAKHIHLWRQGVRCAAFQTSILMRNIRLIHDIVRSMTCCPATVLLSRLGALSSCPDTFAGVGLQQSGKDCRVYGLSDRVVYLKLYRQKARLGKMTTLKF